MLFQITFNEQSRLPAPDLFEFEESERFGICPGISEMEYRWERAWSKRRIGSAAGAAEKGGESLPNEGEAYEENHCRTAQYLADLELLLGAGR